MTTDLLGALLSVRTFFSNVYVPSLHYLLKQCNEMRGRTKLNIPITLKIDIIMLNHGLNHGFHFSSIFYMC